MLYIKLNYRGLFCLGLLLSFTQVVGQTDFKKDEYTDFEQDKQNFLLLKKIKQQHPAEYRIADLGIGCFKQIDRSLPLRPMQTNLNISDFVDLKEFSKQNINKYIEGLIKRRIMQFTHAHAKNSVEAGVVKLDLSRYKKRIKRALPYCRSYFRFVGDKAKKDLLSWTENYMDSAEINYREYRETINSKSSCHRIDSVTVECTDGVYVKKVKTDLPVYVNSSRIIKKLENMQSQSSSSQVGTRDR